MPQRQALRLNFEVRSQILLKVSVGRLLTSAISVNFVIQSVHIHQARSMIFNWIFQN